MNTLENLTNKFHTCYQIQINDENNTVFPVLIGKYKEIPLVTNKVVELSDRNLTLHYVTYIMTQEDIDAKIYKIIGVTVFDKSDNEEKESKSSIDFIYEDDKFKLIYCDHINNKIETLEIIDNIPKKNELLTFFMEKTLSNYLYKIIRE